MTNYNKLKKQLKLEQEMLGMSVSKYNKSLSDSDFAETLPGKILTRNVFKKFHTAYTQFLTVEQNTKRTVGVKKFFNQIPSDVCAALAIKRIINSSAAKDTLQNCCMKLFSDLNDYVEYQKFFKDKGHVRFLKKVEENLKTNSRQHRRTVIMRAKRLIGITDTKYNNHFKLTVGNILLDIFCRTTGLAKVKHKNKDMMMLQLDDRVNTWLQEKHNQFSVLDPTLLPMIVKPLPWTNLYTGGYLTSEIRTMPAIRLKNKNMLDVVNNKDFSPVLEKINKLQEIPYCINKQVLEVMGKLWRQGSTVAGLPPNEKLTLPVKFWNSNEEFKKLKKEKPEKIKEWKRKAAEVYQKEIQLISKRLALAQKLWIAEKFKDEEEIYFVWNFDWRGRIYPLSTYVNPQADDSGKSLLQFKVGKPLGERGWYWLAVHLANEYGEVDKESFHDRVNWVLENEDLILTTAENPYDNYWWTEADHPFMFLAACFEWAGYRKEGDNFISHLPISMDGSNNGLQHLAAIGKSKAEGKLVNLLPAEKPTDIYAEVAKVVDQQVNIDANNGVEFADLWVGKIDRSVTKRAVMTKSYGVKLYGVKDQLIEFCNKQEIKHGKVYIPHDVLFPACGYLAKVIWNSLNTVINKSEEIMNWFQECIQVIYNEKYNKPLYWKTPAGFHVFQNYVTVEQKRYRTFWGSLRIDVSLLEGKEGDKSGINKRKMANGISPNFIHSYDSAHLLLTMEQCIDEGMSFMPIHDSFGVHACDVDRLHVILREKFVEIYSQDVLANFKKQLIAQLPKHIAEKLPDLPLAGSLDIEKVKQAEYFFA